MTVGMKMFMLAAQELNFTKAAEKAYVTPQCLSDHIKRLENEYHVRLFERRPHLELTAEGKAMLRYFTEIQVLEASMENELAGISSGTRGTIRFGIPATRGRLFIPQVIPEFQKQYPHVDVEVLLSDTRRLEPLLAEGELDLIMGVAANPNPLFRRHPICRENLFVVVPVILLQKKYGEAYVEKVDGFFQEGIEINELNDVPLVMASGSSTTATAIHSLLLKHGLKVRSPIVVSNFDILLDLCLSGSYATICLMSNIGRLLHKEKSDCHQHIWAFPIKNCDISLSVELITRSHGQQLHYRETLIDMLKTAVLHENERVRRWLTSQNVMLYNKNCHPILKNFDI